MECFRFEKKKMPIVGDWESIQGKSDHTNEVISFMSSRRLNLINLNNG